MALDIPNNKEIFRQRDVRETPTAILTDGEKVPVGAILPWLKSFAGTPSIPLGYVECDGAVLNDPESVYDGATIPDLNGGEFLRGFTTSGGTGGSDTQSTKLDGEITNSATGGNNGFSMTDGAANEILTTRTLAGGVTLTMHYADTEDFDNRPSYYNVVWIIRIK